MLALIAYNINLLFSDDISHIDGPWIRSAKNIKYRNGTLCADLRARTLNINTYNSYYTKYYYTQSCINISNSTRLMNVNGTFMKENNISKHTYAHTIRFPQVSSNNIIGIMMNARNIEYFPNSICVEYFTHDLFVYLKFFNAYHLENNYREKCLEYEHDDILSYKGGELIITKLPNN